MQKIWQEAEALQPELVKRRRDLHRHPETGGVQDRFHGDQRTAGTGL